MKTYEELLTEAAARRAETDAHTLTGTELARINADFQAIAQGTEAPKDRTYAAGATNPEGYQVTLTRNIQPRNLGAYIKELAMMGHWEQIHAWPEAF